MRILVCNWKDRAHPRAGGAEVWTHGIAAAWQAAGHDVTLACSKAPGLAQHDEVDGIEIVRGGDYRIGVHRHARRVYEARGGAFDLVFDEINTRPFFAPQWAKSSVVLPFIHQVAREVWFREAALPVAVAGRFVMEPRWLRAYRSHRVGALSVSTAASLLSYGCTNVFVPPVGAELPAAPTRIAKETRPTFVFVGRLCSMKRPVHAIRAFRILQQQCPDAQLWIVGTGPAAHEVQRHAGDGITLFGYVTRAERDDLMSRAHALLATSVREGWGLVVSEAAAVGTGAIAYDVPGLVDSVRATGGVLVAPRIGALVNAMRRVVDEPLKPTGTGVVPFEVVADALLAEVSARA